MAIRGGLAMCGKVVVTVKLQKQVNFIVQLQQGVMPKREDVALIVEVWPHTGKAIGSLVGKPYDDAASYDAFNVDVDVIVGVPWTISFYANATSIRVRSEGLTGFTEYVNHDCKFNPKEFNNVAVRASTGDLVIPDMRL